MEEDDQRYSEALFDDMCEEAVRSQGDSESLNLSPDAPNKHDLYSSDKNTYKDSDNSLPSPNEFNYNLSPEEQKLIADFKKKSDSENEDIEEEEKAYYSNAFSFSKEITDHHISDNIIKLKDKEQSSEQTPPINVPKTIDVGQLSDYRKNKLKNQMMLSSMQIIDYHK